MRALSAQLLILIAHSAVGQTVADQVSSAEHTLTISLRQASEMPVPVRDAMYEEVENLLAPAGIHVDWADHYGAAPRVVSRVAVVRMTGNCEANAAIPATLRFQKPESLGETQIVSGAVIPFADVRCDAIRQFISTELRTASATSRDGLLGRALGRVMAHELYHIALRTRSHGQQGIAKPAQSSLELVAERAAFSSEEGRRIAQSTPVQSDPDEPGER